MLCNSGYVSYWIKICCWSQVSAYSEGKTGLAGGGMWDGRSFIGGMRDKNTSVRAGFAHFQRGDAG